MSADTADSESEEHDQSIARALGLEEFGVDQDDREEVSVGIPGSNTGGRAEGLEGAGAGGGGGMGAAPRSPASSLNGGGTSLSGPVHETRRAAPVGNQARISNPPPLMALQPRPHQLVPPAAVTTTVPPPGHAATPGRASLIGGLLGGLLGGRRTLTPPPSLPPSRPPHALPVAPGSEGAAAAAKHNVSGSGGMLSRGIVGGGAGASALSRRDAAAPAHGRFTPSPLPQHRSPLEAHGMQASSAAAGSGGVSGGGAAASTRRPPAPEPSAGHAEQHQLHQQHPHKPAASYQEGRSGGAHRVSQHASGGGMSTAAASIGTPAHSSAGPTHAPPQQLQWQQPQRQQPQPARVTPADKEAAQRQAALAVAQVLGGAQVPRLPVFRALLDLVNNSAPVAAAPAAGTAARMEAAGQGRKRRQPDTWAEGGHS